MVATDPAPNAEAALRKFVDDRLAGAASDWASSPGASQSNLTFTADLAQALAGADLVQENGPERIDFKQKLYGQLDELLPPDVIIASSSSGLTMSEIQKGAASHPERCVIGHPFNPPHLIPLVEIVGGAKTSEATIRRADEFYTSIGQRTVRVNKEMPGHVANRLQAALSREIYYLVAEGVVSAADVDTALSWGPGLRWGVMGGMMLNHLGGGPGGIEHFFQQFTGPMTAWWKTLGSPVLTPEVQKKLIDSVHAEVGSRSIDEAGGGTRRSPARPDRAAQQGCQVEPNEIDGAGRLRPGAARDRSHIRHVFQFFRLSSRSQRSLKCPPQPQQARPPHRSRCPYPTATSISWSTFSPLRRERSSIRCGPIWRPRSSRSSTSTGPMTRFRSNCCPRSRNSVSVGSALRVMAVRAEARSCSVSSRWSWRAPTRRSAPSSACTAAWPWARSISMDPRSRSRNGCRRWHAWKRSAASASPSRWSVRERAAV